MAWDDGKEGLCGHEFRLGRPGTSVYTLGSSGFHGAINAACRAAATSG